jgi:hypothetical protein
MSIIEGGNTLTESRFSVVHLRMTSDRTFADVQAAFERQLGRFEPDVYRSLAEGVEPAAVRARTSWPCTVKPWVPCSAREDGPEPSRKELS